MLTIFLGHQCTKVRPYGGGLHTVAGRTFVRCMHRVCRDGELG